MLTRRSILKSAAICLGAPMINRGRYSLFAQTDTEYSARTIDLVNTATVIDMLGLLTLNYQKMSSWQNEPARFQPADFRRLRDSGITVFHPAVGYIAGDIYAESLRLMTREQGHGSQRGFAHAFEHGRDIPRRRPAPGAGKFQGGG